jgi:hypothetical protein
MMKLNKTVHIMILLTFAIVFVVIYLYYTINDLKKLSVETKKNAQDIQSVVTTLNALNKAINDLRIKESTVVVKPVSVPIVFDQEEQDEEEEEEDEMTHDDIKNILLEEIEEEEEEEEEEVNEETDLTLLKLDQLKQLCKDKNLSMKGTKHQLIERLTE